MGRFTAMCRAVTAGSIENGVEKALYRRGLVFMEQRKFRRAVADFTKAARVIPDAVVASDRARWCGDQQGDAEDAARPGPA